MPKNLKRSSPLRILVIGGGYAGIHAVKVLHKKFKNSKDVLITLVDKQFFHTLMTELHEIAGDRVPEESVRISYKRIFSGMRVEVAHDHIVSLDFSKNMALGRVAGYSYDYLLLATGGKPAFFNIPGVEDHALTLWSLDDAKKIRRHLDNIFRKASFEPDLQRRRALLTIAVAGGGFTGVELAGELIEYIPLLCRAYEIDPGEVELLNVEALGHILPMLPEKPRQKAHDYMEKHGVKILTNALIVQAREGSFTLRDGREIQTETLVWTCGIQGNGVQYSEGLDEGKAGRKLVEASMKSPGLDNVFLAGDGIWFLQDGKPLPQTVEAAEQTAAAAAKNIIKLAEHSLRKKDPPPLDPILTNFHGFMVSIGSRYGVSHLGGISLWGFLAMALKHIVNIYYQYEVAGFNAAWGYLSHEILNIRHRRSLIGGFLSWRTPNYWLVPLRLYLGLMWLLEGFKKIQEGWLSRSNDFVSILDGGSAATEAVETGSAYASALLSEPWGPYLWFTQTFVNKVPYLVQAGTVCFELLLGMAFIAGAFTFLTAAASLAFCTMLILGALTDGGIFWYMIGALAMMGGAGRSLGLDYWITPFLKKRWNRSRLIQRSYLYTGEPEKKK